MDRLPNKPSLDHLRQQAKDLLHAQRATEPDSGLKLSGAQRLVANRYGFASWRALKRHVDHMTAAEQEVLSHSWPNQYDSARVSWDLICRAALEHPSPVVRRRALDLLDHHGESGTLGPTVLSALKDPVPRVRRHALHALTCTKCRVGPLAVDVVGALVRVSKEDENEKVRLRAVDLLGRFHPHDDRARGALERINAHDASPILRAAADKLLENPRASYQGSMKVQRRRQRAASAAFIQQTTVDSLVELALNSVDKPDLVAGPPTTLGRFVELYGVEPVRRALARCQQLVETNPSDFTAAGAIKFLEDALEAVQLADR